MGSYISSFKKFMKNEEKKPAETLGANPQAEMGQGAGPNIGTVPPELKSEADAITKMEQDVLVMQQNILNKKNELTTKIEKLNQEKAQAAQAQANLNQAV